jgi:serine/threonine-protein kinase
VATLVAIPAVLLILASVVVVQPRGALMAPAPPFAPTGPAPVAAQNTQSVTIRNSGDGAARPMIQGSGVAASKTWDVAGFDAIEIGSTFHTKITKGTSFKVITSADDNILEHIRVSKSRNTLVVGLESGSYQLKTPLSAEITMPVIAALDLSGASKTTLAGFESERDLKVMLSGASELLGTIRPERADFRADGASTIALQGSAVTGRLVGEGSSHLKLGEFPLTQCELDLNGASTAQIVARSDQPFKAKCSGSSRLSGSVQSADIQLELDGASIVTLDGSSKDAAIEASGASRLDLSKFAVHAVNLHVKLDGASSIKLSGQAGTAQVEGHSASHLDLSGLVAQTADVKLTGSSHATIDARVKLTYDLSSVSRLRYLGDPKDVTGKKSGASTVSRQQ